VLSFAPSLIKLLTLLLGARRLFIDADGICQIEQKRYIAPAILAFDLYVNILLTSLFVIPLYKRFSRANALIRRVAQRTLIASSVSLTVSTVNILVLTILHGHQAGWLCLASCSLDIVLNALALFWVTTPNRKSAPVSEGLAVATPVIFRHVAIDLDSCRTAPEDHPRNNKLDDARSRTRQPHISLLSATREHTVSGRC
jgi:hypothetical protein